MKGVRFVGSRRAEVVELPDPEPGPGEVLVRTRMSAVCGSDLHAFRLDPGTTASVYSLPTVVPGHECCAVVEVPGPGAAGFAAGERVLVHPVVGCAACRWCRAGFFQLCTGGLRQMGRDFDGSYGGAVVVPERNLLRLPDEVDDVAAAFVACNAGTAWAGLRRVGVSGADTVAVFGLGPVGLACVAVAASLGARVVGIDPVPERAALALRAGASATELDGPVEVAVDASGSDAGVNAALDAAAPFGRVVLLGIGRQVTVEPVRQLIRKNLAVHGSVIWGTAEGAELLERLRTHPLPLGDLVGGVFAIDDAEEALLAADAARSGKILFRWD